MSTLPAFVLYQLPSETAPTLLMQQDGGVEVYTEYAELNAREGFVISPFEIQPEQPILLIRPEVVKVGWEAVFEEWPELVSQTRTLLAQAPVTSTTIDPEGYAQAFHRFHEALLCGDFRKLVLSRRSATLLPANFSPIEAFKEACTRYSQQMVYLCYTPQTGLWMGSTPEILLASEGHQSESKHTTEQSVEWCSVALAGSVVATDTVVEWNQKNRNEQQYVADYLRTRLSSLAEIKKEVGPFTVQAGKLAHLKTEFFFTLPSTNALGDLLAWLHPTPAVCGLPKESSHEFILHQEGYNRRYYAGCIGFLSPTRSMQLYVNLRCMNLQGHYAYLYAGGGLLAESTLQSEWLETAAKMETMQDLISSPS